MEPTILVYDKPVLARDIQEGWLFRNPRALLGDPREEVKVQHMRGLSSYQLTEGDVLAFIPGPGKTRGAGEISEPVSLRRFEVSGYGDHLRRIVFQAPKIGSLRAGITVNISGWSSFPPHWFERGRAWPEGFSEVFYFMIKREMDHWEGPPLGLLISGTFASPWVRIVRDGLSLIIYPGLHAVTAMPGCKIGYVWAYTAKEVPEKEINERKGRYGEDS